MDIANVLTSINADVTAVKDGTTDPIRVYRKFKTLAKSLETAMDDIFSAALDECDKYDKRELAERGISVSNGSKRWDYSNCGEWVILNKKIKALEAELKARCSLSQSELVDAQTGEVLDRPTYTLTKRSISFAR